MKKYLNVGLLLVLEILSIVILLLTFNINFSEVFMASDYGWDFSRYYFETAQSIKILLVIATLALLISIILKNLLHQNKGRYLMIISNYALKIFIALVLIDTYSAMFTTMNLNVFAAHMSVGFFSILIALVLVFYILVVFVRELYVLLKLKV